jgi:hypothetical protein
MEQNKVLTIKDNGRKLKVFFDDEYITINDCSSKYFVDGVRITRGELKQIGDYMDKGNRESLKNLCIWASILGGSAVLTLCGLVYNYILIAVGAVFFILSVYAINQ